MKKYDIVLFEKPDTEGLTREEILFLVDRINHEEVYPFDYDGGISTVQGFVSVYAADVLDYDYNNSGLYSFIKDIISDVSNETETMEYTFKDLRILIAK